MHQFMKFILEGNSACFGQFLCPSSRVFHCTSTHSSGICHTGMLAACERDQNVPSWSRSQAVSIPVWHIPLLCVLVKWKTLDDGQRNCPKHVEFPSKINLRNWCIWLVYYKKFVTMHGHMNVRLEQWLKNPGVGFATQQAERFGERTWAVVIHGII